MSWQISYFLGVVFVIGAFGFEQNNISSLDVPEPRGHESKSLQGMDVGNSSAQEFVPEPRYVYGSSSCSCGQRNEGKRIVGGVEAKANEFPWRCHLYSPTKGVFCGATLISDTWALTAAHCTVGIQSNQKYYLNCAEHDYTTQSDGENVLTEIVQTVDHPKYIRTNEDNDVSLLRLANPLKLSRRIQPICLPWKLVGSDFSRMTVTASGWGVTTHGGKRNNILKKVDLPTLSTYECRKYYGNSITDNMMCTYSPGRDTCQGDSGGSIDYKDPRTGRYSNIGVVSWGVGCAGVNKPGVYAKVTKYLGWIQYTTRGTNFCRV